MNRREQGSCSVHSLLADLKSCTVRKDLNWGRRLHSKAVASGNDSNLYVATALIRMYAKTGSMSYARRVFDCVHKPDVVCWSTLLLGYAETGEGYVCLDLFSKMKEDGYAPDFLTYVAALKACASIATNGDENAKAHSLQLGSELHLQIGDYLPLHVENTLIHMYAKTGCMVRARQVFDSIKKPDVVSWTTLLMGYAENGEGLRSLELYSKMKADRYVPNSVTYVAVLKACKSLAANGEKERCLKMGREIHSDIGDHLNAYVQSKLIDVYAECGSMADACRAFDAIQIPDSVSWTALLSGYAENGEGHACLELFSKMKAAGCVPDSVTYVAALKACTSLAADADGSANAQVLQIGREIHLEIGDKCDPYVQSTLIDMYAKFRSMISARQVFDSIQKPNVVCWTALLSGYADNGEGHACLELFSKMKANGCVPNSVTYVAALKACTSLAMKGGKAEGWQMGRKIHAEIGDQMDSFVQSTLIDMYAKCGSMVSARRVFDNQRDRSVVAWTALLSGYAENEEGHICLELFSKMKVEGFHPDSVTYVAALKACTSLAMNGDANALELGRGIHCQMGDCLDLHSKNTLIDMYCKCHSMVEARRVFDSVIPKPDRVSWTALLLGYAENGEGHVALDLFSTMKAVGCAPDSVTYIAALKACGSIGALELGRKFHAELSELTVHLVTCLVDLYAKCGSVVEARAVFDLHPNARDLATWNALLAGYSSSGDAVSVFSLFKAMQEKGFQPDGITLLCMLLCCSHAGLVRKARQFLEAMPVHYGVIPNVFHYNCMVDVLGRANQLSEALSVLRGMPCSPNAVTWSALLDACRDWKNVEIGTMAFEALVEMDKSDASSYVLMAHIYGSQRMWEQQECLLSYVRDSGSHSPKSLAAGRHQGAAAQR